MLVYSGTNLYVEHGGLVPDVPFDHGKDTNLHVKFATPAYVIRRCERPFYEWTDADFSEPSQDCSLVFIVRTTSLSDCTETLGREPYHAMSGEYE